MLAKALTLWPWIVAGGVPAVALVAGLFLAPAATIGLLRSLVRGAIGAMRKASEWAQSNWWRAACVLAALTAGSIGWMLQEAEQEQASQKLAYNAALLAIQQERDRVASERDKAVSTLADHEALAAREYARITADLKSQQEQNADLAKDLKEQAAKAAKSNQAWWKVYEGRSDSCKAAQEALGVACKEIGRL